MIRLLIVDDEPLVQIGIKSMLDWSSYGIEVCGTASNGQDAMILVERFSPRIIITDLKMPIMGGLELMHKCLEKYGRPPLFIVLANYEEFHLVKEALSLHAIDYLIKIDLTKEILEQSIRTAIDLLEDVIAPASPLNKLIQAEMFLLHERFFISLLNNMFEDEEQFHLQAQELSLDFNAAGYLAAYVEIDCQRTETNTLKQKIIFLSNALQLIKTSLQKHFRCYITAFDLRHFAIIFLISEENAQNYIEQIRIAMNDSATMLHNFYDAYMVGSVGRLVDQPLNLSASFHDARLNLSTASREAPLIFYHEQNIPSKKNMFSSTAFRNALVSAYEELNPKQLQIVFSSVVSAFRDDPSCYLNAMDAACNILYLSISSLSDGEQLISKIFKDNPDNYRCLFTLNTTTQVIQWLNILVEGLCNHFESIKKDKMNQTVSKAKQYIQKNYTRKLSLNEVATTMGISPNYLSLLFRKHCDYGFIDFVNHVKINEAKKMLNHQNLKIYEVASLLGYDNAFYFSKVFKRMEGCSPTEYINKRSL